MHFFLFFLKFFVIDSYIVISREILNTKCVCFKLSDFTQNFLCTFSECFVLFKQKFSPSIQATAYLTLSPLLTSSNLRNWTALLFFFALLIFPETIQITADALYKMDHLSLPFPQKVFIELMEMTTSLVELSFNDIMYYQIDGVAMGSPLEPALANIFVGYYETKLFQTISKPAMYYRYMDDTFAVFNDENQCEIFLERLNLLHPSLRFTMEKESHSSLPFVDVLVEKCSSKFITSIYRKPTFTGQFIRWNSFSLQKRKTNLILALTHRALSICSPERLQSELDKIKSILLDNGYPEYIINSYMTKKSQQFHNSLKFCPEKCPVYLHLPWLGLVSNRFEKQITSSVKHCYLTVEPHVVYKTNQLFPVANKDVLPALRNSNVIYQFSCHCDSRYVGRSSQRLQDRIKQHVPKSIRFGTSSQKRDFQFANVNIPPSQQLKFNLSRMIRPLDFNSYAISLAINTTMTACSLFSQKNVRHFNFQLLKPPSLKLRTLFSADKKNSFIT